MGLKNLEIEFKYAATVPLIEFQSFCELRKPLKVQIISGFDHFMSKDTDPDSFYRHRVNTLENQLTFKRKTIKDNSFIREEHNIDLPLTVSRSTIESMCGVHGYKYNVSIFKNCFIYTYAYYTLVFYSVYDINLNEMGRFIEIEMKEDYDWVDEKEAFGELITLEKLCKVLNIDSSKRINTSLYEMFRKDTK